MEDLNVESCEEVSHCGDEPRSCGNEQGQDPKWAKDQED
jgi:hypothetical protein